MSDDGFVERLAFFAVVGLVLGLTWLLLWITLDFEMHHGPYIAIGLFVGASIGLLAMRVIGRPWPTSLTLWRAKRRYFADRNSRAALRISAGMDPQNAIDAAEREMATEAREILA